MCACGSAFASAAAHCNSIAFDSAGLSVSPILQLSTVCTQVATDGGSTAIAVLSAAAASGTTLAASAPSCFTLAVGQAGASKHAT